MTGRIPKIAEQRPADPQEKRDEKSRASSGDQQQEPPSGGSGSGPSQKALSLCLVKQAERLLEALAQAQAGIKKKLELRPGTVKVEKDW